MLTMIEHSKTKHIPYPIYEDDFENMIYVVMTVWTIFFIAMETKQTKMVIKTLL